ncbi:MAG: D-alanyl-D-alanine carboxypeptidase [Bacteroidota bacterium]
MKIKYYFTLFVLTCILFSFTNKSLAQKLNKEETIQLMLDTATTLRQSFTGFVLYNPKKDKVLIENYPDKYFTPASNTKLYTYFTASRILKDSLPVLGYKFQQDSLIFWGTGYPLLLNKEFDDSTVINFLSNHQGKLFYYDRPTTDERFGPGWGWSDYQWYYSSEKSKFPIYGNHINFRLKGSFDSLLVEPQNFKNNIILKYENAPDEYWPLYRAEHQNEFHYYPKADTFQTGYEIKMPFMYSKTLFLEMLEDVLHKKIKEYDKIPVKEGKILRTGNTDTLYRKMLQESDNFLAEQIMMMCSSEISDSLGVDIGIKWAVENLMQELPDKPIWRDGSGLSRYNMFTPRTTVKLLTKLQKNPGTTQLFKLLPNGGKSGTIENWYGGKEKPYVFAKTGTLSNNHCLSGYVVTRRKKTLIFSFMLNHYIVNTSETKKVMQQILEYIYEHY